MLGLLFFPSVVVPDRGSSLSAFSAPSSPTTTPVLRLLRLEEVAETSPLLGVSQGFSDDIKPLPRAALVNRLPPLRRGGSTLDTTVPGDEDAAAAVADDEKVGFTTLELPTVVDIEKGL